MGTFSGSSIVSGYAKGYTYDSRLKYLSPPRFLNAVQAAWQVSTWGEDLDSELAVGPVRRRVASGPSIR